VGNKTAERYAFHLLDWKKEEIIALSEAIVTLTTQVHTCEECGCFRDREGCRFCTPLRAAEGSLCIIASPRDLFPIEATGEQKGLYHVLGGLLSPLDGIGPEAFNLSSLKERLQKHSVEEVVIALDSTIEGDATALFLKSELESLPVAISRLAFGLPMGSSLEYVDGGTLARALASRNPF
jgi:recombination protein RecR